MGTSPLSGVTTVITPRRVSMPMMMAMIPMMRQAIFTYLLFLILESLSYFRFIFILLF